jgi:hypothetical protein
VPRRISRVRELVEANPRPSRGDHDGKEDERA